MKYVSTVETAKMIRAALKVAFPSVKFSVKSHSYAGGSSIRVSWYAGPNSAQVEKITKAFEGSGFDGMCDLKYNLDPVEINGEPVQFGVDYVFAERKVNAVMVQIAAYRVHKELKLPLLQVKGDEVIGGNEFVRFGLDYKQNKIVPTLGGNYLSDLIYQVARGLSFCEAKEVELPQRLTAEHINKKVAEMLK